MDVGVSYQGEGMALGGESLYFSVFGSFMDVGVSGQGSAMDLMGEFP